MSLNSYEGIVQGLIKTKALVSRHVAEANGLIDTDQDGFPNDCPSDCLALGLRPDGDDDGDGINDPYDAFPLDADEADLDGDGVGTTQTTTLMGIRSLMT